MEELIRQAFVHVEGLGPHVAEGHYDLISPLGEIILPKLWETMVQPGWSITMHMWPMPAPPPPRHFPNKPGFPPTPAASRPQSLRQPPAPPMNWPGGPSAPESLPHGPDSAPVIVNLSRRPPSSRPHEEPTKKDRKESRHRPSSTYTGSTTSDNDHEDFVKNVTKFASARRVYKVGKMGRDNFSATYQVSPKKEGMKLLNEYGRKFIDEARKVEL